MNNHYDNIAVFDRNASEYDSWFDTNVFAYQSEVGAIRRFIPKEGIGVEIGAGTGRFSVPFGISIGVELSESMAEIARAKGIAVHKARTEHLPFESESFDFALMVTTLCFIEKPLMALREAARILKSGGNLILGFIDKESKFGKVLESKQSSHKFYSHAVFYAANDAQKLLSEAGFSEFRMCQTIFSNPGTMTSPEPVRDAHGEGGFVVINSIKP